MKIFKKNQSELKLYRAKYHLTQLELAEKLGSSRELINKLENGKAKPSEMFLMKFDMLKKGE